MKENSFLRERYLQEVKKIWSSQKMIDYCMKKADAIIELENNDIYIIEKPTIETSFCFGHGFCGVSTTDEQKRAENMADYAIKSEDYFLEINLQKLQAMIDGLKSDNNAVYKSRQYLGLSNDDNLKGIFFSRKWEKPDEKWIPLTDTERQTLITGYEEAIERFKKRLKTYLKRYGTTKLNVWTYLVD